MVWFSFNFQKGESGTLAENNPSDSNKLLEDVTVSQDVISHSITSTINQTHSQQQDKPVHSHHNPLSQILHAMNVDGMGRNSQLPPVFTSKIYSPKTSFTQNSATVNELSPSWPLLNRPEPQDVTALNKLDKPLKKRKKKKVEDDLTNKSMLSPLPYNMMMPPPWLVSGMQMPTMPIVPHPAFRPLYPGSVVNSVSDQATSPVEHSNGQITSPLDLRQHCQSVKLDQTAVSINQQGSVQLNQQKQQNIKLNQQDQQQMKYEWIGDTQHLPSAPLSSQQPYQHQSDQLDLRPDTVVQESSNTQVSPNCVPKPSQSTSKAAYRSPTDVPKDDTTVKSPRMSSKIINSPHKLFETDEEWSKRLAKNQMEQIPRCGCLGPNGEPLSGALLCLFCLSWIWPNPIHVIT